MRAEAGNTIIGIAALVSICLSSAAFPPGTRSAAGQASSAELRAFDYDPAAPLGLRELSADDRGGVAVRNVTFASPKGGDVPAYLVLPLAKGSRAGIVYMHWGQGNRTEFLAEAILMARGGAASILLDAPFMRAVSPALKGDELPGYVQMVVDCRRAVDVLAAEAGVDVRRVAYVGHSLGATWGGVVAASEPRFRALVLMAGFSAMTQDVREASTPEKIERVKPFLEAAQPFDSLRWLERSPSLPVLFQYAKDDSIVSRRSALRYEKLTGPLRSLRWYDGGHELNDLRALADRASFLGERLGLSSLKPVLAREAVFRAP